MPRGYDLLRPLRSTEGAAATPVVVISADAMTGQRERMLEGGAAEYLTKPLDIRKFFETLDRTLGDCA